MLNLMTDFCHDDEGATAIEYGLIAALVTLGALGTIIAMATSINQMFNYVSNDVATAVAP